MAVEGQEDREQVGLAAGDEDIQESSAEDSAAPVLDRVRAHLQAQGVRYEITSDSNIHTYCTIWLPTAAEPLKLRVFGQRLTDLLSCEFGGWKALRRYVGFYNEDRGEIEVGIRAEFTGRMRRLLQEASGHDEDDVLASFQRDDGCWIGIRSARAIGPAIWGQVGRYAIAVSGVEIVGDADDYIEPIADSVLTWLDSGFRVHASIMRRERRRQLKPADSAIRPSPPYLFPSNRYPHEAAMLYRSGRQRDIPPSIRYWSLYQVLEYFFPAYALQDARHAASIAVKNPVFNPHSTQQVDALVAAVLSSAAGVRAREPEQLEATVSALITDQELRSFIDGATRGDLAEHLKVRKGGLSVHSISTDAAGDLRKTLSNRIYDIRCRIVHSKSESKREEGPGLIPGSHEEDQIHRELVLMEMLALRALIASAEPLTVKPRRAEATAADNKDG